MLSRLVNTLYKYAGQKAMAGLTSALLSQTAAMGISNGILEYYSYFRKGYAKSVVEHITSTRQ